MTITQYIMNKFYKSLILLIIPISLAGQITPVTSQYVLNPLTINPASAGSRGALNIAAFYRKQWIGITGAPETMTLSADAALMDRKLGLGIIITNDKLGVTKETHFNSSYSYKIDMEDGALSFGLGAGLIATNTKYSDLIVIDPGDEYYLADSKVFIVPEFSFGVYYSFKNYFAALSIPKLIGYDFNYSKNKYNLTSKPEEYYYLFNTGYFFTINKNLKFLPSTLITFSPGEKLLYDLSAHFNLYERFWAGVSYRSSKSVIGLIQFSVIDQLKIAYTYDFDFGSIGTYSNGSHEIMLRYEFKYKVSVVNPLVF
jgi:type IX secretion system PorP/SprF family membrane protein